MSKVFTNNQNYHDIAEAIREKNESSNLYLPSEMADAIRNINSLEIKNGIREYIEPGFFDIEKEAGTFTSGYGSSFDLNFKDEKILRDALWQQTIKINDELFCCCIATTEGTSWLQPTEDNPIIFRLLLLEPDENKNLVIVQNSIKPIGTPAAKFPYNIGIFDNNRIGLFLYEKQNNGDIKEWLFTIQLNIQTKTWENSYDGLIKYTYPASSCSWVNGFDSFEVNLVGIGSKMYYFRVDFDYSNYTNRLIVDCWTQSSRSPGSQRFGIHNSALSYYVCSVNKNNELLSNRGEGILLAYYDENDSKIHLVIGFETNDSGGYLYSANIELEDLSSSSTNFIRSPKISFIYKPSNTSILLSYDIPLANTYENEYYFKGYSLSVGTSGDNPTLAVTSAGQYDYDNASPSGKLGFNKLLELETVYINEYDYEGDMFAFIHSNLMGYSSFFGMDNLIFRKKNKREWGMLDFPSIELGLWFYDGVNILNSTKFLITTLYNCNNNISYFTVGENSNNKYDKCFYVLGTGNQTLGNESTRKLFFNNYNYMSQDYWLGIDSAKTPSLLFDSSESNLKLTQYNHLKTLRLNENKIVTLFLAYNPNNNQNNICGVVSYISEDKKTITNGTVTTIASNISMFKDFHIPHTYPDFSDTKTYSIDDIVRYDGQYYICTTAVSTAGAWTGSANWNEYSGNVDDNEDEGRKYNAEVLNESNLLVSFQDSNYQLKMKKVTISGLSLTMQEMNLSSLGNITPCYLSNFKILSPTRLVLGYYLYNSNNPELSTIYTQLCQISGNYLILLDSKALNLDFDYFYPIIDFIPIYSNKFIFVNGFGTDYRNSGGSAATDITGYTYKLLGDKLVEVDDFGNSFGMNMFQIAGNVNSSMFYSLQLYDDKGKYQSNIRRKIFYASFLQKYPSFDYGSPSSKTSIFFYKLYHNSYNATLYNWKNPLEGGINSNIRISGKFNSVYPRFYEYDDYYGVNIRKNNIYDIDGKPRILYGDSANRSLVDIKYDFGVEVLDNLHEVIVFPYKSLINSDETDLAIKIIEEFPFLLDESGVEMTDSKCYGLTKNNLDIDKSGDLYMLKKEFSYYPEQIQKKQINITNVDLSEEINILIDEGMTWGEWIDSTYNNMSANCLEYIDSNDGNLKYYTINLLVNGNLWYIYMGDITDYDGTSFVLNSQIRGSYEAKNTPPNV